MKESLYWKRPKKYSPMSVHTQEVDGDQTMIYFKLVMKKSVKT